MFSGFFNLLISNKEFIIKRIKVVFPEPRSPLKRTKLFLFKSKENFFAKTSRSLRLKISIFFSINGI
jgi:hypothetical protein